MTGDKCLKSSTNGTFPLGCCDMSIKCRIMWRREHEFLLCSCCNETPSTCPCFLGSSSMVFFAASLLLFGALGMIFAWLTFTPFMYSNAVFDSLQISCQPDNEGSWSIGIFFGEDPFSLRPIELAMTSQTFKEYNEDGKGLMFPIANPVLTCASVVDPSHPSTFVADPFLYMQGSKWYIFFESKNALTNKGEIGVSESSDGGASWKYLGIALEEEWHLSFPYVFDYDGQIYMMPEGSKKGDLRLYRALNFPLQWTLERVLIKRPLVDATMLEYKGKFWIFGSDFEQFGAKKNGELEVWYASTPFGPWKQHKGNPLHNENRSYGARNGGRPFIHDGKLYRVGQDCGETYGRRVRIFRVDTLTTTEFHEVEVPLGLEESKKGRNAWNGLRYHQLDVQKLPSGGWIGVMDGDRVPSGDITSRYLVGFAALLALMGLVLCFAIMFGYVRCVFPLSKCLSIGKRSDVTLGWIPPQIATKLHRILSRLNRNTYFGRDRNNKSTSCAGISILLVCFLVSVVLVCIGVRSFFGGNGADEPYLVDGKYSQFTMIAMTYEERLWNLQMYVKHYSRCASVREIVVVWNKGQPPNVETDFDSAVPIRIRVEDKNSLNNRFKPDPQIKTQAVLELDDDIMMTCNDLERGFKAWRNHPNRIVGYYPRLIDGSPLKYRNERYARANNAYNMILTGGAFLDWEVAFTKYWSEAAEQGRALVDELFNCEDILLNFVLANSTTSRIVEYIHPAWAIDTSKISSSAISRDTKLHYLKRENCLNTFSKIYGLTLKKWEFGRRGDSWDY